jgi:MFS family permease
VPRLWTKFYIIILIISLSVTLSHYMLITSMADYLAGIGGSAADAGILGGAFTLAALLSRPFIGKILDSRGRRVVLIGGSAIILAASAAYPLLTIIPLLVLLRMFHGIGYSSFTTSSNTIVADIVPATRLSEGLAFAGIGGTIATATGPVLGIYLAGKSYGLFFTVLAALGLVTLAGSFLVKYEKREPSVAKGPQVRGKLYEKSAMRCSIVILLMSLPLDAVMIFISTYGAERGMQHTNLFFPVHATAMLLSRLTLGRLADRVGPNRILLSSLVLEIAAFVMLAYARTDTVMILAAFIFGIPLGISFTIMQAILIRTSPRDSLGAANATFLAFADIGFGLGSIVMGYSIQYLGFTAFFLIGGVCILLSMVAYLFLIWSKAHKLYTGPQPERMP